MHKDCNLQTTAVSKKEVEAFKVKTRKNPSQWGVYSEYNTARLNLVHQMEILSSSVQLDCSTNDKVGLHKFTIVDSVWEV